MREVPPSSGPRYPGIVVRTLLAIMVAALLGVPVASTAGAPPPNVKGTLYRGPIMPVCIEGRPCDAPARGVVLVFSHAGADVKRVTTGAAGRFALRLSPGWYAVRTLHKPRLGSALTPARLRAPASGVLTIRLHLDTGIR